MTSSDLDIAVRLALWLGMEKIPAAPPREFSRAFDRCKESGVRAFVVQGDRLGLAGGGFWDPLSDPAQAAEVMAEAARRGWCVVASIEGGVFGEKSAIAVVHLPDPDPSGPSLPPMTEAEVGWASSAREAIDAWCRSVCLAVLEAIAKTAHEGGGAIPENREAGEREP